MIGQFGGSIRANQTSLIAIMFCIKGHKTPPSLYFPNEIRRCLRGLSENTWSVYEARVDYMLSGLVIQHIAQLHLAPLHCNSHHTNALLDSYRVLQSTTIKCRHNLSRISLSMI